jgi:hypothetical protein
MKTVIAPEPFSKREAGNRINDGYKRIDQEKGKTGDGLVIVNYSG